MNAATEEMRLTDLHAAEPPPYPDTPRWVKVFGTIFGVVVLMFFILLFSRGANHGPGRHIRSKVSDGQPSQSSVTDHSAQQQ
jgi:hypothetical protein